MQLPEAWANVDWRPSVVLLPEVTDGVRTFPLNRDKYPQFPRGYFMMATSDQHGEVVYYNAADVGAAGALVSQFVFWHEIGHFRLGHVSGVAVGQAGAQPPAFIYTGNNETDADRFACNHWLRQNSVHGWNVIQSAIKYFDDLGNAPGDAEHPAPRDRMLTLRQYVYSRPAKIIVYDDQITNPDFVKHILTDSFEMSLGEAQATIQKIESMGSMEINRIRGSDIDIALAQRLVSEIVAKARITNNPAFRIEGGAR